MLFHLDYSQLANTVVFVNVAIEVIKYRKYNI